MASQCGIAAMCEPDPLAQHARDIQLSVEAGGGNRRAFSQVQASTRAMGACAHQPIRSLLQAARARSGRIETRDQPLQGLVCRSQAEALMPMIVSAKRKLLSSPMAGGPERGRRIAKRPGEPGLSSSASMISASTSVVKDQKRERSFSKLTVPQMGDGERNSRPNLIRRLA